MPNRDKRKRYNQYFTPRKVAEALINLLPVGEFTNAIDLSVGDGVFLEVLDQKTPGMKSFGIDIDQQVINRCRVKLDKANLYCGNTLLDNQYDWKEYHQVASNSKFDLAIGNPPFSSWYDRVRDRNILELYELGKKRDNVQYALLPESQTLSSQAIEVLFLEKFIKVVKPNGFIAIILPSGILANPQYQYVRNFILRETSVKYIISLPRKAFSGTLAKTAILVLQKKDNGGYDQTTPVTLLEINTNGKIERQLQVSIDNLSRRMDFEYHYQAQDVKIGLLQEQGISFKPLGEFITYFKTGGTLYGKERKFSKSGLRFLHATNITELGINYKKGEKFIEPNSPMDISSGHTQINDILFVRVGVGCAGRVAIVGTEADEGIATDYIHIFRVRDIDPYFLVIYLKTRFGRDSINLLKHGVGTVSINKTDLLSLPIPVVPQSIQMEIEEKYKSILSDYRKYRENNTLQNKMSSLLRYLEEEISNYRGMSCYVEM
ncbi:MAG: N-6 DNA methylase [Dehalococcoidia bacterium]|nr:N-6 DNA methylase [Dehalococcoidia bacterium]